MTVQKTGQELPLIISNDIRWEAARLQNKGRCREIVLEDLTIYERAHIYTRHGYRLPSVLLEEWHDTFWQPEVERMVEKVAADK